MCSPPIKSILEGREATFVGTDQPDVVVVEPLDRRTVQVELADVTLFLDFAARGFAEPTKRQSLGATHVGTIGVDATGPLSVEKRAGPAGTRRAAGQQPGVATTDPLSLDFEDAEIVDAAGRTTAAAAQPARVTNRQLGDPLVDLGMQRVQGRQRPFEFGVLGRGVSHVGDRVPRILT